MRNDRRNFQLICKYSMPFLLSCRVHWQFDWFSKWATSNFYICHYVFWQDRLCLVSYSNKAKTSPYYLYTHIHITHTRTQKKKGFLWSTDAVRCRIEKVMLYNFPFKLNSDMNKILFYSSTGQIWPHDGARLNWIVIIFHYHERNMNVYPKFYGNSSYTSCNKTTNIRCMVPQVEKSADYAWLMSSMDICINVHANPASNGIKYEWKK